ncbi:uncharacterized protein LOC136062338 [Quercus suber]|uniref:uncharacterized protein LOC136062338 n=1 Tax=Quercus suber TaxID=58331 RepID=UPI000D2A229F|nr:uncharacterized protein CFP56_14123 [Quercus suber]
MGAFLQAFARASFKEKLVGEMPGAFVEAFDFENLMEEDDVSDAEDGEDNGQLREGWVSVKLTKETKRRIRGPWSKSIIVKLVGRTNSLLYMRTKLNQMWRPTSRMDCVDLSFGFFLVRFFSKEDLDNVLMKGPWFIGGQFLSIRPWEPFFKPSTANVSLIAVWIRLYELPIELYEAEVLKELGESIGKVLRIDSHTAMEARGKYARLCVQIDINKPLVNTILIGHFEQVVSYEGIQSLCFSYGRLGHRRETCLYTIRKGKEQVASDEDGLPRHDASAHEAHAGHGAQSSHAMADVCETKEENGQYGPWMVVSKRTNNRRGTKTLASTESTSKSAKNIAPQQPPKFSELRNTVPSGPAFSQGMTRKESLHGAGNQSKRTESVWTPRDSSKVGPVDGFGPTKGAEASVGPLNISSPQAQTQRKYPASVKGKKGIDRGLSQSFPSNSDRASVRELSSAKSPSLPPFHVSSLNRASADLSFTFSASSSEPKRSDVADEDLSDLTEQQCLGDG